MAKSNTPSGATLEELHGLVATVRADEVPAGATAWDGARLYRIETARDDGSDVVLVTDEGVSLTYGPDENVPLVLHGAFPNKDHTTTLGELTRLLEENIAPLERFAFASLPFNQVASKVDRAHATCAHVLQVLKYLTEGDAQESS